VAAKIHFCWENEVRKIRKFRPSPQIAPATKILKVVGTKFFSDFDSMKNVAWLAQQ
jgi:hypothetical protein